MLAMMMAGLSVVELMSRRVALITEASRIPIKVRNVITDMNMGRRSVPHTSRSIERRDAMFV